MIVAQICEQKDIQDNSNKKNKIKNTTGNYGQSMVRSYVLYCTRLREKVTQAFFIQSYKILARRESSVALFLNDVRSFVFQPHV